MMLSRRRHRTGGRAHGAPRSPLRAAPAAALATLPALAVLAQAVFPAALPAPTPGALRTNAPAARPGQFATASPANLNALPRAPARDLFVRVCTKCHAADVVTAKRHTPEEWDDLIGKMVDRGAMATEDEQERIFEYLVRFYGKSPAAGERQPPASN